MRIRITNKVELDREGFETEVPCRIYIDTNFIEMLEVFATESPSKSWEVEVTMHCGRRIKTVIRDEAELVQFIDLNIS